MHDQRDHTHHSSLVTPNPMKSCKAQLVKSPGNRNPRLLAMITQLVIKIDHHITEETSMSSEAPQTENTPLPSHIPGIPVETAEQKDQKKRNERRHQIEQTAGVVGSDRIILNGENLSKMDLSGINLSGAKMNDVNLKKANMKNATLDGASLERATLVEANLTNASLKKAKLFMASLKRANLENADLTEAYLGKVSLQGANMNNCNFSKARLHFTDLRGCDLSSATLTGTDLREARYNKDTKWPPNFHLPELTGAVLVE
ncbi:MAG: pentapeptide repeat-containing protein [Chloroflexi bacterium]|nr:pentapeptide repeat-containing protein [Chloroflexota bacterium]